MWFGLEIDVVGLPTLVGSSKLYSSILDSCLISRPKSFKIFI